MDKIITRRANVNDADAIVRLIRELAGSMGETTTLDATYVRHHLSAPGSEVLLTESEEAAGDDSRAGSETPSGVIKRTAVGLLSYSLRSNLFHAAPSALIEEFVVSANARGRGVGSALLEHLFGVLKTLGCAEVSVTTMPENHAALKFYRSHGMTDEAVFLEKHF